MAMAYTSEPKEASFAKIKKYFMDYYPNVNIDTRLKHAIDKGVEKGHWERVSGTGSSGSFRLEIEEYDPVNDDDDITTMIANSIMACSEPKQASARSLKNYVIEYHKEFKVADKPFLFKKALERAVNKDILKQLTGIGSTGTFQLSTPFIPSPVQLKGEDSASYYDSDSSEEWSEEESDDDADSDYSKGVEFEKYKPRPTKSRGQGRTASTGGQKIKIGGSRRRPHYKFH